MQRLKLRPKCHYTSKCPFKLVFQEGRNGKETARCISKGECNQQQWSFERVLHGKEGEDKP